MAHSSTSCRTWFALHKSAFHVALALRSGADPGGAQGALPERSIKCWLYYMFVPCVYHMSVCVVCVCVRGVVSVLHLHHDHLPMLVLAFY